MLLNLERLSVIASYLEEAGGISITRWNMMNSKERKDYVEKHPKSKYAKWDMFKKDIDNNGMFYKKKKNTKKPTEPKIDVDNLNNDSYSALDSKYISSDEKKALKYCDNDKKYPSFPESCSEKDKFLNMLKMNYAMIHSNDERIGMAWLTIGIPDGASEQELYEYAGEDGTYEMYLDAYNGLVKRVKSGYYD